MNALVVILIVGIIVSLLIQVVALTEKLNQVETVAEKVRSATLQLGDATQQGLDLEPFQAELKAAHAEWLQLALRGPE